MLPPDPREDLLRLQGLLATASVASPFHRARLAGVDLGAAAAEADAILSRGDGDAAIGSVLDRVPLLTKAELAEDQARHPPYGTVLSFDASRYVRVHATSATTGTPLRWLDTAESWRWMIDCWDHVLDGARVTSAQRVLFAFSFGPFLGFWVGFEAAVRRGCFCVPGATMSSEARVEAMAAHQVDVLCATPTYALHLGQVAYALDRDDVRSRVRKLIVAGEPGGSLPAVRDRLRELWPKAAVLDHYGLTECGPITWQALDDPERMHVVSGSYLCEVIDPATGIPLAAGDDRDGELVVTNLGRVGSPVLRYRTGDLVRRDDPDARMARALRGGVRGRADDMAIVRGVNLFPSSFEQVLRRFDEIVEYQVEIDERGAMTEARVKVELRAAEDGDGDGDGDTVSSRIAGALRDALQVRIGVKIAPEGSLPRFELKARRWLRIGRDPV